ncbi:MAG TPA: hypothetical protein VMM17_00795 [Gemmatimonadaceae bacterium]|nr:hypothetical protein [Gemmatimonadaceae bacterium]
MASYSTTTAAIALGVNRKQLENLLGRCRIPGTSRGRQGRARRLPRSTLLAVAAVLRLQRSLGIPASLAVDLLADGLLAQNGSWPGVSADGGTTQATPQADAPGLRRGPFLLVVDIAQLERELAQALAEAIEMSPRPRRGRPPGSARLRHG